MLNYPKTGDKIVVQNVSCKEECRAYRVFEHYIEHLQESTDETVFICEPVSNGVSSRVYACNFCKTKCKVIEHGETRYYQCTPKELDLFDGHRADGTYVLIGIGDEQPDVLAALSVEDRMSLSVLKMADATFKAYSGPGYATR